MGDLRSAHRGSRAPRRLDGADVAPAPARRSWRAILAFVTLGIAIGLVVFWDTRLPRQARGPEPHGASASPAPKANPAAPADINETFPGINVSRSEQPLRLVLTGTVVGKVKSESKAFIGVDEHRPDHERPYACITWRWLRLIARESDEIVISLSEQEALVLFDLLARINDGRIKLDCDQVEMQILADMEAGLEKKLPQVFAPAYADLVQEARGALAKLLD